MCLLDQFVKEIYESLPNKEMDMETISNGTRYYFNNENYGEPLKKCFDILNIKSYEFRKIGNYNNLKICSVSSSARLCFLYLLNRKNIEFEVKLHNPTQKDHFASAQLDAKEGNIYYECKCQEILYYKERSIKAAYKPFLEKYFGIHNLMLNNDNTLSLDLNSCGIELNKSDNKLRFDLKQVFTHSIAISEKHRDKNDYVKLQYIFFTPIKENMSAKTKRLYNDLNNEIDAILNSKMMKHFNNVRPNVEFSKPKFVPVSDDCFGLSPKDILNELKVKNKN